MKYIGNKTRLLDFIFNSMSKSKIPMKGIFCDIFGGTGSVGNFFKKKGFKIISNDIMTFSYVQQFTTVMLNTMPSFKHISNNGIDGAIKILNSLPGKEGYVYENFCPSGRAHRQYFSDSNGKKIDAIRDQIDEWRILKQINKEEFMVLLCALLNAADFVANISGTYGAYLKIWRSMALKNINLIKPEIFSNFLKNEIYQKDANDLIQDISCDVLYLDPPYNERQYASNFHVLESLAVWDKQLLKGKTGQRDYDDKKSLYCMRQKSTRALSNLILNAKTKYIVLSYNNEGIIPRAEILKILSKKGKVNEFTTNYRRFRTERDNEHRQYKKCDDKVVEHLFIVKCN